MESIHKNFHKIEAIAKKRRAKIGIGILRPNPEVIEHLKIGQQYADLVVVCKEPIEGFECLALGEVPEEEYSLALINLLKEGKVEGIVRGHVKFGPFEKTFMREYGYKKLRFMGLLRDLEKREWFYINVDPFDSPGPAPEEMLLLIEQSAHYLKMFGIEPVIAMTAGDFTEDRGDNPWIDQTIHNAEYVVKVLRDEGYNIKNYAHLIDEAIKGANLIVLGPTGSHGNFLYRILYQVGGAWEMGGPVFVPEVYIECSRYHNKYSSHIIWAVAEANLKAEGKLDKVYDPYKDPNKKWSIYRVIK
jgi:predicted methyltransferase MtxX (methanogen marker protein 4)